jgi:hypothetical protein
MVPTRETDKAISPARQTPAATRHAVHKLRAWIECSFAEAGREVPADVAEAGLVRGRARRMRRRLRGMVACSEAMLRRGPAMRASIFL